MKPDPDLTAGAGPRDGEAPSSELTTWLAALVVAVLLLLLAGCQSAPARDTATAAATAEHALRSLGFEPTDEGWLLGPARPIQFAVDRDDLDADARRAVSEIAQALLKLGITRVRVEGHADSSGRREYNAELSRRRADAVARALVAGGFADVAVARRGLGIDYPIAPNDSRAGRAQNRRVTIIVLGPD